MCRKARNHRQSCHFLQNIKLILLAHIRTLFKNKKNNKNYTDLLENMKYLFLNFQFIIEKACAINFTYCVFSN